MRPDKIINSKILSLRNLNKKLKQWKAEGNTIVFSNGCFDILHYGHIDYLSKASALGDKLIIGLNSDASVKRLKGLNRPINDEKARAFILSSLFFVDAVVVFEEDTPYNLINKIKPDILVKGKDYKVNQVVGYNIVKAKGGIVKTIKLVEGYSTSIIESKIIENFRLK